MQKVAGQDIRFMREALRLARKGGTRVHPNPRVGAVLVKGQTILSRAAHDYFGGPHAEVNVLRRVKKLPADATLYTTLEPCGHWGKTPPCVELILAKKISRVVIAAKDPNPLVSGKSLLLLKKAGVRVTQGVLEEEAEFLNRDFRQWITKKIPYVTVKIAQTLDGKIATAAGESRWITGPEARRFSHGLRAETDAVLVGVNTVLKDDPRLDARLPGAPRQPLKVILDGTLKTPSSARIFAKPLATRPLIFTTRRASARSIHLLRRQAEVVVVKDLGKGRVDLNAVLKFLGKRGIVSLLIEGGGEVIASALTQKIVNECYVFVAPKILGGGGSVNSVGGSGIKKLSKCWTFRKFAWGRVGDDFLLQGFF